MRIRRYHQGMEDGCIWFDSWSSNLEVYRYRRGQFRSRKRETTHWSWTSFKNGECGGVHFHSPSIIRNAIEDIANETS